jgi:hypothetical protein
MYYRIKNKIINKNMERKYFKAVVRSTRMNCLKTVCCSRARTSFRRRFRRRVSRGTDNFAQDPPEITDLDEPAGYVAPLRVLTLQEWSSFNSYGVQGGVILMKMVFSTFFRILILLEQCGNIKFLVSESVLQ